MTEQQQQTYRERLLALGDRLKGDVSGLRATALRGIGGEASGSLSNAPLHLADLATDTFEQEVAIGLLENQQEVLGAIGTALDRLDAGTYGRCERCGMPIKEGRLMALPYTSYCVTCQAQVEKEDEEADMEWD